MEPDLGIRMDPVTEVVAAQAAEEAEADGRGEAVEAVLAVEAAEPYHNMLKNRCELITSLV